MTGLSVAIRRSLAGVVFTCFFLRIAAETNGDVILMRNGVKDRSYSSGRVLIYTSFRGTFGSVKNDDYFDMNAATVICQQLQFDGAYGYSDAGHDSFGNDGQPLIMQQVICDSDRYLHILECQKQDVYLPYVRFLDVSVYCRSVPIWNHPFVGQIRLADGNYASQGRVEVYCNGAWGTVCAGGFDEGDARLVCQQLGYSDQQQFNSLATVGSPSSTGMPVWMDWPGCSADPLDSQCLSSCVQCSETLVQGCPSTPGKLATVSCVFGDGSDVEVERKDCDTDSAYPSNGELVRAEADDFNQSLLIYYKERWNFLCGDSFSQAEADVACHQMGHPGGAVKFSSSAFNDLKVITPMGVVSVDCTSADENHLLRCQLTDGPNSCQTLTLLSCSDNDLYTPYEGEVRLVDGVYPSEGRLEIYLNGQWGTVCNSYVDSSIADVACRQLGYTNSISIGNLYPGDGTESIWAWWIDCSYDDVCLSRCLSLDYSTETSYSDCSHSQDISIKCNYSVDSYGAGTQDECNIDNIASTTSNPNSSESSFGFVELTISIAGAFVFLLLLIACAVVIATCILKSRRSSQAYRHLGEEGTGMNNVVADDESSPTSHRRASAQRGRNGLTPNPNLPSLQFSYALVVPPEEEYSPSFDDPIPDEPPPPYTAEDPQTLNSTQQTQSLPQDSPQTNGGCTMHENPECERES